MPYIKYTINYQIIKDTAVKQLECSVSELGGVSPAILRRLTDFGYRGGIFKVRQPDNMLRITKGFSHRGSA
jgi:hypothetical protein